MNVCSSSAVKGLTSYNSMDYMDVYCISEGKELTVITGGITECMLQLCR